jgi:hypothetical protein
MVMCEGLYLSAFLFAAMRSVSPLALAIVICIGAQSATLEGAENEYVRTASMRADRIVASLGLHNNARATRVRRLVTKQYCDLNRLHGARDAAVAQAKASAGGAEDSAAQTVKAVRGDYAVQVAHLHYAFLGRLAAELSPEQIEQVKDGMTYGVLPLTYRAYQDLVPTLTDEQKRQILAWLTEAREHAMDAGSSHEKHGWFGKYKGRINNYLAAAGIDLKQAERNLRERQKTAQP